MASIANILICCGLAILVYSLLGLPLTVRFASRPLAIMLAPAVGWAVHSVIALPLFFAIGMSQLMVIAVFALPLIAAVLALWKGDVFAGGEAVFTPISLTALGLATLLAFAVTAGVVPKVSSEGVSLAGPMFDHSKIAIIDEIARLGVPPGNPFFGGAGTPTRLTYYYLWHFSAAELSLLTNASGWEADAALTWFTAFSSLILMSGLATWLSGRAASAIWVILLAATASLRPLLNWLFGVRSVEGIAGYQSGFGAWLFQTFWAPQHTAAAMCAVIAIYLLVVTVERYSLSKLLLFVLLMAAGFESSTWVGGFVIPLAAASVALILVSKAEPQQRNRHIIHLAIAALLAILLISPLLYDQLQMAALRGGSPVAIAPYEILVGFGDTTFGILANLPAFWLIFLVVEFPAFYLTGLVSLYYVLRDRALTPDRKSIALAFALLLAVSLVAAWLLKSTLGENNDLGWRAALPAAMTLIVFAAIGLSRLAQKPVSIGLATAVTLVLLGVPDAAQLIHDNIAGSNERTKVFAYTPALWQEVRRYSTANERVANNPLFLKHVTPWDANISWALLSNRRSCYAGQAFSGPFTALSQERREQIEAQFVRVFAGHPSPGDIEDLFAKYDCRVAVITAEDGGWNADPFAGSSNYRLLSKNHRWRIYRAVKPPAP